MGSNVISDGVPCIVLGATGYVGSELLALLHKNSNFTVVKAFGSAEREPVAWQNVAPQLAGNSSLVIEPWHIDCIASLNIQAAFLALPHEASARLAPSLLALGIKVFDLSGAFRFQNAHLFANAYGFEHPSQHLLANAQYMLMPWLKNTPTPSVYAIPGCYPTAAILGLKPLVNAGLVAGMPVITAISGVTGAGKGAHAHTSFCEVSMQAYGVLNHRHQPEISQQLGTEVVFTPVLGPYARGILAVCTVQLNKAVAPNALHELYSQSYEKSELIMLVNQPPAVNHVAHTAFCHVHVAHNENTAVVTVTIDNLIMGAAGQAMQAANHVFGVDIYAGLK